MPLTRITSQLISIPSNYPLTGSLNGTASYATTASFAMNGGSGGGGGSTSLTGITFPYVSGSNTYTLSQSAVAANDLLLSVNGIVQTPTTDYTVSASSVTFTDSYPSGSSVNVRYLVSATSSSYVDLNNIVLTGTTTGDAYYPQVSALLHFDGTNGSTVITDNSKNNLYVTASNGAAISTAQSKFGGSSLLLDGTNDYLSISSPTPGFSFGTGDFTIEMWVYKTGAASIAVLIEARSANTASPWDVAIDASNFPYFYDGTSTLTSNIAVTLNSWVHLAWVRTSGVLKIFVNGVQGYSAAHSVNLDRTAGVIIGSHIASVFYYQGYIDELRITNGYARYTSNFTPPTAAFSNTGGDVGKALVVNSTATGVSIGTAGFNLNSSNINRVINGAMAIDQRNAGASQTITAAAALAYTVDRWYAYCTGANVTGQRITGSANNQYAYRFTGAASVTGIGFGQRIEAANSFDLAGSTVTLGVDLANSVLTSVTWTVYYANTSDTFGTLASPTRTQISTGTFTVNSTLSRYSTQIFIPSAATTGIEIVFSVGAQTSGTWTIDNVQLEAGPLATPFERRNIAQELVNCQRYYSKSYAINTVPGTVTNSGCIMIAGISGATYLGNSTRLVVPMRTTPNVTYYSPTSSTSGRIGYWGGSSILTTTNYTSGGSGITDSSIGAQIINVSTSDIYWHYTADAEL